MKERVQSPRWLRRIEAAGFGWVMRFIALAFVVAAIAFAASHLQRTAVPAGDVAEGAPDPLSAELNRCRTVTSDQLATDETCRRVWAENRRRFFTPGKPTEVH